MFENHKFINQGLKPLEQLIKNFNSKKIFIINSKQAYHSLHNKISPFLKPYDCQFFDKFEDNPNIEDIKRGIKLYNDFSPDLCVAIGGGSALDMGKSINFLANQSESIENLIMGKSKNFLEPKVSLIALPTTAGTGAEETSFSVIYIEKTKYSLSSKFIKPNSIIADISLVYDMPKYLAGCSSFDALTQSIESYWARGSDSKSSFYAIESIKLIMDNMIDAVNNKKTSNIKKMVLASNFSGKAINITKTTVAHALSYSLTSYFKIPHGHSVAFFLPPSLKITFEIADQKVKNKINNILNLFGVYTIDDFIKKWKELMKTCDLNTNIFSYGLTSNDKELIISKVNPERMNNHPVELSRQNLKQIVSEMFYIFS